MDLKPAVESLLLQNRRNHGNYQYTVPSPDSYPYQWLWDSCFHAIILSYFNTEDAKKELLSLIAKQFDNGMIPHMIYWDKADRQKDHLSKINWGKNGTSTITQPPMLAYAALEIYKKDQDKKFLSDIYPAISKFSNYLLTHRDPHGRGLAGIINPDESGEDNSPRFDIALNLPPSHTIDENFQKRLHLIGRNKVCKFDAPKCMRNFFWVKDVPFNAILVENLNCLSEIASILELDGDSEYFNNKASIVKLAMRKLMLQDGLFYSTFGTDYRKIKVITWAIFSPLFGNICTKDEVKNLVDNYLFNESKFGLPFVIPTVSKEEPSFDPNGFWRGPVWMSTNWFVYKGLKKYGYHTEAKKIKESSIKLLEMSGLREQYDPITGEGLGARDFTWGGLVLDMV